MNQSETVNANVTYDEWFVMMDIFIEIIKQYFLPSHEMEKGKHKNVGR